MCPGDNLTLPPYRHALRWARRHEECWDPSLVVVHRRLYDRLRIKMKPVGHLGVSREL